MRKGFAVENAEAVGPIFGNGNAARVEEPYAGVMRVALVYFDMRVSEQECASLRQFRHIVDAVVQPASENMAVRAEQTHAVSEDERVIAHAGELEHHLVDFRIAIAACGHDGICALIEHGGNAFGVVALGLFVSWSVLQNVAEQNNLVGSLLIGRFQKLFAPFRRAVNV